ncbi:hypothetical protein BDZ94DRAFT_662327 [Collybia nuda]|uniref:Protein kinase domain-containing protein n=1 Tax=Collybia nuda TaxID=64659 RepID=A0A9P5XU75_9AGAR|nr:hypothetical protein BDZ94DRAFT_662327 [Collybia nuda]
MTSISHGAGSSAAYHTFSSASSAETPDIFHDYVQQFFRYRPETLRKAKNHTPSPKTRTPAFFDRHLDSHLQLLHVVYLPSITADLMKIADDALQAACLDGSLPPMSDQFPTQLHREAVAESVTEPIICEEQIRNFYKDTTAQFCSRVAATLEFQLPVWTSGRLRYTLSADKNRGIADGFLKIDKDPYVNTPISESYTLVAGTFPTLALWEFKSLTAGTSNVMEAIVQQTVSCLAFSWEGCDIGKKCIALHARKDGSPPVTGNRMGLDADPPICPSVGKSIPGPPNRSSAVLSKNDRQKAGYITQQTWSEAVQDDVTFVVINSGNFEIIGIRNRKQQTLFLSDVIKVDDCDYGRLHTGLYIAILRDALNRTLQLRPPNIPASWTRSYNQQAVTKMSNDDIMNQACLRDWLVIQSSSKKRSLTGFKLDTYYFRVNPSKELKDNTLTDLRSFFRIILQAQFGQFIAKGILEVDGVRLKDPSSTAIIKVAHTDDAIAKLYREHEVYLNLLKAGVSELPRIIGFFQYVDIEGLEEYPLSCAVLITQDMGSPVCHVPEDFTRQHLTLFQKLLTKIHQAGFVHTKLSRDNLIIRAGDPVRVSIVSLGDARRVGDGQTTAFDDEDKLLLKLLPNPCKHLLSGETTEAFNEAFPTTNPLNNGDDGGASELSVSEPPRKKGRISKGRSSL